MTADRPALRVAALVFAVHDLEEILQTERMNAIAHDVRRRLPEPLLRPLTKLRYTPVRVAAVVAPLLAAQVGLTLRHERGRTAERLLSLMLAGRFANGVTHLGESAALRRYVPGAATAPAVMVAAGLALRSLRRDKAGLRP
jgi:hypothetical protein